MFKSKCMSCAEKIERKFNYCPFCGASLKNKRNEKDYGMLGRIDGAGEVAEQLRLPFGMGKMVESLVKQLEKQMNDASQNRPPANHKGFKIKISAGPPPAGPPIGQAMEEVEEVSEDEVSEVEFERRMSLPKIEASSKVRRLGDKIIYEIDAPNVRGKEDVVVTELATGLEVKIYSAKKCFVKFIPLKVEMVEYYLKGAKVFLELRI